MPYNKTISRLKELEPEIVETIKDKKTLMELKRESKSTSTVSKGGRRNRSSAKVGANDGDTSYRNCSICNKRHYSVCCLAGKNGHGGRNGRDRGNSRDNRNKRKWMSCDDSIEI